MLRAASPEMVSESNLTGCVCAAAGAKNTNRETGINARDSFSFIVLNPVDVSDSSCGSCSRDLVEQGSQRLCKKCRYTNQSANGAQYDSQGASAKRVAPG